MNKILSILLGLGLLGFSSSDAYASSVKRAKVQNSYGTSSTNNTNGVKSTLKSILNGKKVEGKAISDVTDIINMIYENNTLIIAVKNYDLKDDAVTKALAQTAVDACNVALKKSGYNNDANVAQYSGLKDWLVKYFKRKVRATIEIVLANDDKVNVTMPNTTVASSIKHTFTGQQVIGGKPLKLFADAIGRKYGLISVVTGGERADAKIKITLSVPKDVKIAEN